MFNLNLSVESQLPLYPTDLILDIDILCNTPCAPCCVNQEEHLGRGTRTNIYSGTLRVKSEEDEDAGYASFQEFKVVLKELGSGHRDISFVSYADRYRLCAADLMRTMTTFLPSNHELRQFIM